MLGGRLKLKLRPWRQTAVRDGNDDGTNSGELRTTTNKRNKYSGDLSTHYLRRRKNLDLSRRTTYGVGKT
uniref:Uncharacterized protein n=1 Tax=Cucumis melo TaxID=3656 RepID=A0A9I9EEQ0_CUCME